MRSSETVRKAYLQAMGVTLWRSRTQPLTEEPDEPAASTAPTAAQTTTATAPGMDWDALQSAVAACQRCELHTTRTQTVFGVGNRAAQWLFVGEAPGADEDRQGEPFVGRAGQLLNAMIEAIGLKREEVYIANVLKCRPPGNRDPQP
ncbi:MAG: uracil-DNA glycosylase family protein, partial [Sulfurifustaceae bacterium]